jgi:uncharacterized protein YggE
MNRKGEFQMRLATIALILVALPLAGQVDVSTPPRHPGMMESISVTGNGKVTLTPDRVSFTIGVESVAPTVADATRTNTEQTARVIAALKRAGATDREIRTTNFSIYPQYEYIENRRPNLVGYQVSNNITVTKNDPAEAGRLLQAAIDAGANNASGLSFTVSDETRGRDEGLRTAFNDAKQKAQVLAQSAGRALGRAVQITEGSAPMPSPMPPPMYDRAMAANMKQEVAVAPGSTELNFTVSVIFELR